MCNPFNLGGKQANLKLIDKENLIELVNHFLLKTNFKKTSLAIKVTFIS